MEPQKPNNLPTETTRRAPLRTSLGRTRKQYRLALGPSHKEAARLRDAANPLSEHPNAGADMMVRMMTPGYDWEDGEITEVHPGGRAKVHWGSGSKTTIPARKVAPARHAAHIHRGLKQPRAPADSHGQRPDAEK